MLLNNEWVNNWDQGKKSRYFETKENENITTPNPCDTLKALLRGKLIAL